MSSWDSTRWGGLAAVLGGALWMALRPLVLSTWAVPVFGLDYVNYNRMMVVPLILLIAGAVALRHFVGRGGRWGVALVVLGLAASLVGVMIEFWWAGGLSGNRQGAMLGWGIYGLGLLGQAIGLAVFGIGALRSRRLPYWMGIVPLAMAALLVLWPPMLAWQLGSWSILDQVLYGLGWVALGYTLWSEKEEKLRQPGYRDTPRIDTIPTTPPRGVSLR